MHQMFPIDSISKFEIQQIQLLDMLFAMGTAGERPIQMADGLRIASTHLCLVLSGFEEYSVMPTRIGMPPCK